MKIIFILEIKILICGFLTASKLSTEIIKKQNIRILQQGGGNNGPGGSSSRPGSNPNNGTLGNSTNGPEGNTSGRPGEDFTDRSEGNSTNNPGSNPSGPGSNSTNNPGSNPSGPGSNSTDIPENNSPESGGNSNKDINEDSINENEEDSISEESGEEDIINESEDDHFNENEKESNIKPGEDDNKEGSGIGENSNNEEGSNESNLNENNEENEEKITEENTNNEENKLEETINDEEEKRNNEENNLEEKEENNSNQKNINEEENIIENKENKEENEEEKEEQNIQESLEREEEFPPDDNQESPPDDNLQPPPDDKQEPPPDDNLQPPPDDKQEPPPDDNLQPPPDDNQEFTPEEPPDDKENIPSDNNNTPNENNKPSKDEIIKSMEPNIEKLAKSGEIIVNSSYTISAVKVGNEPLTSSRVDLSECIHLLKTQGIISSNESLIILQLDSPSSKKVSNEISFALYFSNLTQIDISYCNNTKIKITSSVNTSLINNFDKAKSIYDNNGYDIFNINDAFYTDDCSSYTSENGTDLTLKDRQNIYFEEINFCDDGCIYESYNFELNVVNCICENITNSNNHTSFSLNTFFKKFINVFKESNIKLVKCYNSVFDIDKLRKNVGSYVMIGLFGFELIILFLYCESGLISTNEIYEMLIKEKDKKKNINSFNKNKELNRSLNNTAISGTNNEILNLNEKSIIKEKIKFFNISPFKQLLPINKNNLEVKQKKINEKDINKNNNNENISKSIIIYPKKKYGLTYIISPRKEMGIIIKDILKKKNNNFKSFILQPKKNLDNFDKKIKDDILNKLPYEQAIEMDKRSFSNYYLSEIKNSQSFIFTFITSDDGNNKFIKIILFIFNIAMYFCWNTLFFSDNSISYIHSQSGSYNYIYFLPKSIVSSVLSGLINTIFKLLALNNSIKLKSSYHKYKKNLLVTQIKLGMFLLLQFFFLLFFWYFTTSFCAVYINSQKHLFKSCLLSLLFSMIFPFFFVIMITILRLVGIRKKNKILYNISKFLSIF